MARFTRVAAADEIPDGSRKRVGVGDHDIVILHQGGAWYAIHYRCPHTGGPLGDGMVAGGQITCPQHRWRFDLKSGRTQRQRDVCARVYPIKIEGDDVYVGL